MPFDDLRKTVEDLSAIGPVSVALYDYRTGLSWSHEGGRPFHAASTIKIAVLAAVYAELERRKLTPLHRLRVRNRFVSVADGSAYRISPARDANAEVHAEVGRTMQVRELATHMIVTSSNLATNVLVEFAGAARIRQFLSDVGVKGIEFARGVEDDRAFEAGIVNRVTADGLVALLGAIYEARFCWAERSTEMIDTLAAQQFNSGIPAGLPPAVRAVARVAHKTGEISTVTHDAGLVFLPGRPPYALAILTGHPPGIEERFERIRAVSSLVYGAIAAAAAGGAGAR